MPVVLILGARAPVALDHARRFARQGWKVCLADSISCKGSVWSRSAHADIRIPSPRKDPRGFVREICVAAAAYRADLLLPTCEEVFYVSRYRDALPAGLTVVTDHFDKLTALHSKLEFLKLATGCGAKVPSSAAVSSLAAAREWAGSRPVVLKPEFSRFGVHVRLYPQGVPADAPELDARLGRWIVQEFCAGEELCSYSVALAGELTAHVVYRPLYRLSRSSSYYFDPARVVEIRDFVARFVRKTGYTGQISFDWIQGQDGQFAVLECNPRAISGAHLFSATDALPAAFTIVPDSPVEPAGQRAKMIAAVMLTAGLVSAVRENRLSQWLSDCRRADDVITAQGDRLPLLGNVADLVSHALRAVRGGCSVREAATRDIEWDGEGLPEC